jgi:hypothetical protein
VRDWVPQLPHEVDCMVLGLHTPSPVQVDQPLHAQALVQIRDWSPQLPHVRSSVAVGVHTPSPEQADQLPHAHDD